MTKRDGVAAYALWGVAHEKQIHYSQGPERFAALDAPRTLPLSTDCSAFATLAYKDAGAPDPNGLGYNGTGYTGTLLGHLEHIDLADAQRGDLIVYGPGAGDHVVIIIEPGDDPLCVSHGQEAGPIKVRHSVEARAHRKPFTVLRGEGLDEQQEDEDLTKELQDALAAMENRLALRITEDLQHGDAGVAIEQHVEKMLGSLIDVVNPLVAKIDALTAEVETIKAQTAQPGKGNAK